MSDTYDVQITIDAETILSKYGKSNDPNNPINVDPQYIYMVVAAPAAVSGNGGGELKFTAHTTDTIRWRETTPGVNYESIIYGFQDNATLISTPQLFLSTVSVPVPNPTNPLEPTEQTVSDYFWNSVVLQPGELVYHFKFMVVDRKGGIQGYYQWDPFISISQN